MIALAVIIVILFFLLILPVGADASYFDGVFTLKVKAGPFRLTLLPKKNKTSKKPKKSKKPKAEKEEKPEPEAKKKKPSLPKLTLDDVFELLGIVFRLLGRFRRYLSIDQFILHLAVGAEDPFDAVMLHGRLNAALGALAPGFHRAFKVRNEDVKLCADVTPGAKTEIEGRLAFSWQIWELLHTINCALFSAIRWYLRKRRALRRAARAERNNNVKQGSKDHSQLMEQKG